MKIGNKKKISEYNSPVIIIGMHRSGTSLITNILNKMGLYIGNNLNNNYESKFFVRTNDFLLRRTGGSWVSPEPLNYLLSNPKLNLTATKKLNYFLNSINFIDYLGLSNILARKKEKILNGNWGWKDPRNTFTLPLWKNIFPNAKIVYIRRNGVDVAHSIVTRQTRLMDVNPELFLDNIKHTKVLIRKLFGISPLLKPFIQQFPLCLSQEACFLLWELYTANAENIVKRINNKIVISYESLLREPKKTIIELTKFCELSLNENVINEEIKKINLHREFAFLNNPNLKSFYKKVEKSKYMLELGYSGLL